MIPSHIRPFLGALSLISMLMGCASEPVALVQGPLTALPVARPANIERVNTGSLFQANSGSLFTGRRKPRAIGDTVKVNISETLSASNTIKEDASRESSLSSKGPGNMRTDSALAGIFNQSASASGSNTFKGDGTSKNDSSFTGQLAASVINVLANGNLVVAGERSIALHGGGSTLRFSGVVDPRDIRDGNVIQSSDVVNARLEVVAQGDVSEIASRTWMQRVLSRIESVW
ncbi:flagellar basal body L-ring protein FlgH [Rhodoferax sp.]|uniref:flagellar basal body L-ring protein FlgH n=1 Tax=Rhodoferax sp. TaxID=50421 RepID=UPI002841088C|nr:flagellar basal body L-ring protein FlgH [Rhodoferax sp.]MDR3370106.1 flagellar basal body L-ring protein FlgH [Rhodoferax sp.]